MPSIEERLALLEAEREILRTLHAYGHAIDYGDEEEFLDCWLEDAALHWPVYKEPIVGREALRAAFQGHTHAPALYHKHVVVDPRIDLDGDTAHVMSYYARLDEDPERPFIRGFGRYQDVLVRCEDGRWRSKERRTEHESPPLQLRG